MTQRAIDGDYVYFVTTNVQDRRWFFVTPERAAVLGKTIQTCCRMKRFELLAYCILPNHVHLLVQKLSLGELYSAQRTLGNARCASSEISSVFFLFPHRRLPSRRPAPGKRYTLSDLMHSIKSTFSQHLHQGKFWQHRSNFRIIETDDRFYNTVNYIIYNYRKMNLPDFYGQSPFVFVDWGQIKKLWLASSTKI